MPNPYFFTFEVVVLGLFILCFKHAWKIGLPIVWQLFSGVLFGLLLEWGTIQQWLAPLGAIFGGALGVLGTNAFIVFVVPRAWYMSTVLLTLGGALLLVLVLRPRFYAQPVDPLVFWIPFAFHGYFTVAGLISKTILNPPLLLLISIVMAVLVLYLHRQSVLSIWSQVDVTFPH